MSHAVHLTKDGDFRARVVAALVLGLAAMGIWAPILGSGVLWGLPMLAVAGWLIARGPMPRDPRFQLLLLSAFPIWVVLAVMLSGLSPSVLSPGEFGATREALTNALINLRDAGTGDPWALAAWLIGSGTAWLLGSIQASRANRTSMAIAFFLLAIPFAAALLLRRAEDAPWHGAIVLAAALLWATRSELRAALPAIATVAAVAVVVSALIGPKERMLSLDGLRPSGSAGLSSEQTYGPLKDSRTGATMFEVNAPNGALWRMQTLDWFDGRGWSIDPRQGNDDLPQPGAVATTTRVRLQDLRDARVAAPGRVISATSSRVGGAQPAQGEASVFASPPSKGETYTVVSEVVDPSASDLAGVKIPVGREYTRYKELYDAVPRDLGTPLIARADELSPDTGWGQVYRLARDLSGGTSSQLEVVQRVQAYLVDSGKFRYSTSDVPSAGSDPLVDFLTASHVGYCQHFAGAAALLLRLAGVPVRVAVGFATGDPIAAGTFEVRDEEAHAWIEVYFPGTGWVPFNPTPGDAEAKVDQDVGVPPPAGDAPKPIDTKDGASSKIGIVVLGALIVLGFVALIWQRIRVPRTADPLGEVLVRLVPAPAPPSMTLSELRPDLVAIGPAVAKLAADAEWQRFGTGHAAPEPHPRRRVLRALLSDVGPLRTLRLLLFGPGRRPVVDEQAASLAASSVAPPPASGSAPPPSAV